VDGSIPELRREPAAFARVLATKEPRLLVGGQAVNLWAMYYGERTVDLAPFVSHDVDVLGDRQTLVQIASLANAKARFFPMRPPTNEVGVVMAEDTHGKALAVEVLSDVHGVTKVSVGDVSAELLTGHILTLHIDSLKHC